MSIGKRLLLFSSNDPQARELQAATSEWGTMPYTADSLEEFRSQVEGGEYQWVLVEDSEVLRRLISEGDPKAELLRTPLAEVEKRHILRVLASTGGNKTRAARILGIDTKTLYNKLKTYGSSAAAYRRQGQPGKVNESPAAK